jgi:hypothetical protein
MQILHDEVTFEDLSEEGLELELLRCALVNEPLFLSIKAVFESHKYPERLDPTGLKLYNIFKRLSHEQDS